MTESRLSLKTKLCAFVEESNDKDRKKILQAFNKEAVSSCASSHDVTSLIRCLFVKDQSDDSELFTNQSLKNLCQSIWNMKQQDHENNGTNTCDSKDNKTKGDKSLTKLGSNNRKEIFKRLPMQMIALVAYLLSEQDIITFERCCRVVYQTINNDSFLTNYNGFNRFVLDAKMLTSIVSHMTNQGFFKLRFVKHLGLKPRYGDSAVTYDQRKKFRETMLNYFNVIVDACQSDYYDDWLVFMFKSISELSISCQGNMFWPSLPIDLLFNKHTSNLQNLYIYGDESFDKYYEKFKKKYIEWFQLNRNNVKIIDYVDCYYGANRHSRDYLEVNSYFQLFNTKHLSLQKYEIDPKSFLQYAMYHPNLETISFFRHRLISKVDSRDYRRQLQGMASDDHSEANTGIHTLKLESPGFEYLLRGTMVDPVNWMHSLKHVTVHLRGTAGRDFAWCLKRGDNCITTFEACFLEALSTKYSFQLEKINILFDLVFEDRYPGYHDEGLKHALTVVNWFFPKLWSKAIKILPNSLIKQVNVGWRITTGNRYYDTEKKYDHVFSWKRSSLDDSLKQMQQDEEQCRMFFNDPTKRQYSQGCLRFESLI